VEVSILQTRAMYKEAKAKMIRLNLACENCKGRNFSIRLIVEMKGVSATLRALEMTCAKCRAKIIVKIVSETRLKLLRLNQNEQTILP